MRYTSLLLLILLGAAPLCAQNVNDAVEIDHQGTWYPGKVLQVDGERYFVSYDGWSESWNEWVGKERLRRITPPPPPPPPPSKYAVGDRVEIQFGFNTAKATVTAVDEGRYELKVDGMSTMWYTEDLILRKL